MPMETVKLIARFKVDLTDIDEAVISEIYRLSEEYKEIVNELIEYTHSHRITSHLQLWYAKYHEVRQRYPMLPTHYITTACRCTVNIYKSFMEMRKLGMCDKEKPTFKGRVIWFERQLFRLMKELLGLDISLSVGEFKQRFVAGSCEEGYWGSMMDWSGGGSGRSIIGRLKRSSVRLRRSGLP